jgi:hypothetical protein
MQMFAVVIHDQFHGLQEAHYQFENVDQAKAWCLRSNARFLGAVVEGEVISSSIVD